MKYLGIDFGSKRVGVAISDEGGTIARPIAVLKNDTSLYGELDRIIVKEQVDSIVVGNSVGNKIQTEINEFIGAITLSTMLPVEMMNEALTSVEAHGRKGKEQKNARQEKAPKKPIDLDAKAAAVILQRYLDSQSRK